MELLSEQEKKTIIKHYGVRRVHKSTRLTTFDLCLAAARHLMDGSGNPAREIDFLISVTQTPDYLMPSNSTAYQDRLGLPASCICLEIQAGCSGYNQALLLAAGLLQNPAIRKGLVLAGETTYNVSPTDKSTYPFMGDAGTATLVEFDQQTDAISFNSLTDGSLAHTIRIPGGGARTYVEPPPGYISDKDLKVLMDGESIKDFILHQTIPNLEHFIAALRLDTAPPDFVVLHQVNQLIIHNVLRKLGWGESISLNCYEEYGNTSSASIPLSLCYNASRLNNRSTSLLLSGFGVGMSNVNVYLPTFNGQVFDIMHR